LLQAETPKSSYGDKGIFPVYELSGQWLIFDKQTLRGHPPLTPNSHFLVLGDRGQALFTLARSSAAYGASCAAGKPVPMTTALLRGSRTAVGRPILAVSVPASFSLKGSRAVLRALTNTVDDSSYQRLLGPVRLAVTAENSLSRPDGIQTKIDFGAPVPVKTISSPFVFVEESQFASKSRRCLRLGESAHLIGGCAEMSAKLMAETAGLDFVYYDPSGKSENPMLLAFTKTTALWGDERWAFVLRPSGPALLLQDATDIRCREGF
jgi:hypothetical protein